ncbi:MAG: hypothetical protein WA709_09030 [Stellaceae bacterium]
MLRSGLQQSRPDRADAVCRAAAVKTAFARQRGNILNGVSLIS